jgi:hypothetical protein
MTASLETLVIAAYIFADSLPIPRPGPEGKITDAELIALAVAQAAMGMPSDRHFLGLIGYRLRGWFGHPPDQSQYNRRLRRLVPLHRGGAAAGGGARRRGPHPARRRHADQLCQLRRLRLQERVRAPRGLRLLPLEEPVRVGGAAGAGSSRKARLRIAATRRLQRTTRSSSAASQCWFSTRAVPVGPRVTWRRPLRGGVRCWRGSSVPCERGRWQ